MSTARANPTAARSSLSGLLEPHFLVAATLLALTAGGWNATIHFLRWATEAAAYRERANRVLWDGTKYLHHVHLASRARNLPGQDERDFIAGFTGLKLIGYQDYASLECGVVGDRDSEIPKAVGFLRRQWVEADVRKLCS